MVVIMLRLIYGPYDTQQGCCHFEEKGVAADSKRKELCIIPFHADLHGPFLHPYFWQSKQRKRVSTFDKVPNSSLPPIYFYMRTAGTEKDQNHCDRDVHKLFREEATKPHTYLHFKDHCLVVNISIRVSFKQIQG
ncbi:hypothetical protein V8G54_017835 [Vigna mungo]|uniref:Uncharacterized protein n=1 Tax=Vigna mungo TaxID=3915 RepID=A0AAQ3NMP0_VIGMU